MIESYNVVYHLHLPLDQIQEAVRAAAPPSTTITTAASAISSSSSASACTDNVNAALSSSSAAPLPVTSMGGGVGGGDNVDAGGAWKNGAISIEALLGVLSANLELNHVEPSVLAPTTITV